MQTIVQDFKLDQDFDKLTGSWDDIVKNYRQIEDEIKKHGQENSAKLFTDGNTFDKVLINQALNINKGGGQMKNRDWICLCFSNSLNLFIVFPL